MTHKFHVLSVLGLTAVLIASGGLEPAKAQVYVLESSADSVKAATAYAAGDRITLPAGTSIRAMMPSGTTRTFTGPYSGTVAELAAGQRPQEGIVAWIKNLLKTGGSHESTPGATRSAKVEPRGGFSWTAVPVTMDSTICVEKGANLQLLRAPSSRADRLTVVNQTTAERGDVEFAAGSETAPWPAGVALLADATYVLLAPDNRARRQVTLRVLDRLPGNDAIPGELMARDCRYQFDVWLKEHTAVGKRKAS